MFSPALKVDDQSHSKASQTLTQTHNSPEKLLQVMQLQLPSTVFECGMAKISKPVSLIVLLNLKKKLFRLFDIKSWFSHAVYYNCLFICLFMFCILSVCNCRVGNHRRMSLYEKREEGDVDHYQNQGAAESSYSSVKSDRSMEKALNYRDETVAFNPR